MTINQITFVIEKSCVFFAVQVEFLSFILRALATVYLTDQEAIK